MLGGGAAADLENELEYFCATRTRTLSLCAPLSQAQFDYRPTDDRWSIGEIVDHVRRAEEFNRNDIRRLIELQASGRESVVRQTLDVVNISVFSIPKPIFALFEAPLTFFGRFVPPEARNALTLTRWITLQNPDNITPTAGRSKDQLRAELTASFRTTADLLGSHPDLDFSKMIFVQPLLGPMNVPELIHWMALHEQRHQQQMCEVLVGDSFPTGSCQL